MSGSAGLFNQKKMLPRREPKGGRSGRWETQKKTTFVWCVCLWIFVVTLVVSYTDIPC